MTKILVIEDEDAIRSNILDLLELEGYEAIGAENGLVGIHLAQQHHPALILCEGIGDEESILENILELLEVEAFDPLGGHLHQKFKLVDGFMKVRQFKKMLNLRSE